VYGFDYNDEKYRKKDKRYNYETQLCFGKPEMMHIEVDEIEKMDQRK